MQSLVNGGLEQGLEDRNSTMLMWVTGDYGSTTHDTGYQFNYFTGYFSDNYGGYYNNDRAFDHFNYAYAFSLGIVNLKTGVLKAFNVSGEYIPSISEILAFADEANS